MIPVPDISQTYPKKGLKLDTRFIPGEGNARDLSVDSNTGTLVSGRAVLFDGGSDYIDCGAGVNATASGSSLVAWVKPGTVGSGGLSSILESCDISARFAIGLSESESKFYVTRLFSGSYDGHTSTTVSAGTWYHVVGTVSADGNTIALYVNGVSMTEAYGSNKSATGTSKTAIGRWDSGGAYYFHGSIWGCKVFNTPLTAAQALELYNNPEQILPAGVSASALKRYYPLCDYQNPSGDSLNGFYFMDLGADKVNGLATGCGMDRAEQPPCPQLGLMPSTSRCLFNDSNTVMRLSPSGTDIDCPGAFTIMFWLITFSANVDSTLWSGNSDNGPIIFIDSADAGYARVRTKVVFAGTTFTWDAPSNSAGLPIGEWVHLAVTFAGGNSANVKHYINGSLKTTTNPDPLPSTVADSQGADTGVKDVGGIGSGVVWDGLISEVAVFAGTEIDADAVAAAYNAGVQGFDLLSDSGNYDQSSNLDGWWKINNPHTVRDLKGSTNGAWNNTPVMAIVPEGTTAGTTVFGNVEEKRLDNAVFNLDGYSRVTVASDADLNPTVTDGYTISVWAKSTCLGNNSSTSMMSKDTGTNRMYLNIRDDVSDSIQFNFGDGNGASPSTTDIGTGNLSDNNWHHYVFILRTSGSAWTTADQFTDGVAGASGVDISVRTQTNTSTADLWIGGSDGGTLWSGAVAYPRIYKRALSANEVKFLYTSGLRVVGGL